MGYNSVVSGHAKSTKNLQVDGLSTGPPSFGASQVGYVIMVRES